MNLRLKLMRNLLESRESKYKKKVQDRFARLEQRLGKRRDDQVKIIQQNLKRDLRKLCTKYRDKQRPRSKFDIIERYADSKSELYALQTHSGEHETLQGSLSKGFAEREYNRL
ncbi:hypothetical protein X777_00135 [Ooceraea biroi]|uniref:Uncharacterized protein n=1 Tax=Ooceraea biroi TaxID=2015173 RepID=A0A026VSH0_OOCBI|nr:hypothetical protein X777_00135 [Ooceraea biroi]